MRKIGRLLVLSLVLIMLLPVLEAGTNALMAPPGSGGYTGANPVYLNLIYNIERAGSGAGRVQVAVPPGQDLGYFSYLRDDAPADTVTTNDQYGNLALVYPSSGPGKTTITVGVHLQLMQYHLSQGIGSLSDPKSFAPWLVVEQQLPQLMPRARSLTATQNSDAGRAEKLYDLTKQYFASGAGDFGEGPEDMARLFTQLCRLFGIPARTVYGYRFTSGELSRYSSAAVIPSSQNTWVEVYVQGIGWIPTDFTNLNGAFGKLDYYLLPISIENSGLPYVMFNGEGTVLVRREIASTNSLARPDEVQPVAIISFSERDGYALTGPLNLNGNLSYDPTGDSLEGEEWDAFHDQLEKGVASIRYRVQNIHGIWSRWAERTLNVIDRSSIPQVSINVNAQPPYTASTPFYIQGQATSPSNHQIVEMQWVNKRDSYPDGRHSVRLRAQDDRGVWSDWAIQELVIGDGNQQPVAVIEYDPPGEVTTASHLIWSAENSYDPDGDDIAQIQWENALVQYPMGIHTVRLRVQDSKGKWSEWASVELRIQPGGTNHPPIAVIGLVPDKRDFILPETPQVVNASYDEDGDMLTQEEWQGRMPSYGIPGTYTVRLRVCDMRGMWSEWASMTFTVYQAGAVVNPDGSVTAPSSSILGSDGSGAAGDTSPGSSTAGTSNGTTGGTTTGVADGSGIVNGEIGGGTSGGTVFGGGTSGATSEPAIDYNNPNYRSDGSPNRAPIAKIQIYPGLLVTPTTPVSLIGDCYDPDWDSVVAEEWENQQIYYPLGNDHRVRYRVKDSYGLWSDWDEIVIVSMTNRPPQVRIYMSPEVPQAGETVRIYGSGNDPDGDLVVAEEWDNRQSTYPAGNHVVRYRAQDSNGSWSNWTELRFTVKGSWWPW